MPGTPKRQLKAVEQLEAEAFGLAAGLRLVMPARYAETPDIDASDEIHLTWAGTYSAVMHAMAFIEQLGDRLRAKAGISEVGPITRLRADGPAQDPTDGGELLTAAEVDAVYHRLVGGEGEKATPTRPAAGRRGRPVELLPAEMFKTTTATQVEVVEWVAANLVIKEAKPENAPCPLAWAMLQDLRADSGARADFLRSFTKAGLAAKEQESKGDPGLANIKQAVRRLKEIRESVAKKKADIPPANPIEPRAGGRA